jgi:hypothetical protein
MFKYRFCFILVILVFSLPQLGCESKVKELPPEDASDNVGEVSDTLDVDIFLDATLSMKGFIIPGVASHYEQTIQLLERAVGKGWQNGKAMFYRFGSTISPIKSRGYLEAAQPGFYTDKKFFQKTFIENVLDSAKTENLTVIVTDLFQNDADVNLLTRKLKEKYLIKNLAIGILGIKSEFNGSVYDVGIRNYSFAYTSNNANSETFRPFYVLMLGKHTDVVRYYEELEKSGLKNFPSNNFLIFSRYLGNPLTSFEGGGIDTPSKIVETSGIISPSLPLNRLKQFKQFRLRDGSVDASFTAALTHKPLPYTMQFNPALVDAEITVWRYNQSRLEMNEDAKQALKINDVSLAAEKMNVRLSLSGAKLPAKSIHCLLLQGGPTPERVCDVGRVFAVEHARQSDRGMETQP